MEQGIEAGPWGKRRLLANEHDLAVMAAHLMYIEPKPAVGIIPTVQAADRLN